MATRCCCPPESSLGRPARICSQSRPPPGTQARARATGCAAGRPAAQLQRQQDVLQRRQRRNELEELEDDAHIASAPAGQRVLAAPAQLLAGEDDLPARRAINAGEQVEQRRFAAARWAIDGEEALRRDAEA